MIRTLLAVAVAAVLVGAALPAIDAGRVHQSDRAIRGELAALQRAANSLVAADETAPGPGARRTVTVALPDGSWKGADVDVLRIRGGVARSDRERATATYRVDGGRERTVRVDAPLYTPEGAVVVGGGDHELLLSLVAVDGRRVVRVRRARASPTTRSPVSHPTVYHRVRGQPTA